MRKTWKNLLVTKIWLVTRLNITQMNLGKEDMKKETVKIVKLVEKLLQKIQQFIQLDTNAVKAGEFKSTLGFNQLDRIMTMQQSIGLRLRKLFPNKEIIEYFSALNYQIDYYFPKCKLAIEVDERGHKDRDQTKENKRQKDLKESILIKRILVLMMSLVKYRYLLISQNKIK